MQHDTIRTLPSLATALTLFAGLNAAMSQKVFAGPEIASDAPTPAPAPTTTSKAATGVQETFDRAAGLIEARKGIRARALLMPLAGEPGLTDDQRTTLFDLMEKADAAARNLSPSEASLQKAQVALESGDLAQAELQTQAVIRNKRSSAAEAQSARTLLSQVTARQYEIAKNAGHTLDTAASAMRAGDLDLAQETLSTLSRAGAKLTAEESRRLAAYKQQIVESKIDGLHAAAGMMQPGVVQRRSPDEAPAAGENTAAGENSSSSENLAMGQPADAAPAQPAEQPAEQPAAQPTDAAPAAQPTDAAAPAAQPEAAPAAPAAPATTDPVELARRYEAQAKLAEAGVAYTEARYNEAQTKYTQLLNQYSAYLTADQISEAQSRLTEAKIRLGAQVGAGGDQLAERLQQGELVKQQILAEFESALSQSRLNLEAGDIQRARNQAATASLLLNQGRDRMSEAEFEANAVRVRELLTEIGAKEQEYAARDLATQTERRLTEAARQAQDAQRARDTRIRESIDRVRALQMEMKYDEALQVVDQILFLDPINPTGLLLKDVITQTKIYRDFETAKARRMLSAAEGRIETEEALNTPTAILNYPDNWPSVIQNRGEPATLAESMETRATLATLDKTSRPVEFNDVSLRTALDWVKGITNVGMDVDWASLERVGITEDSPVTVNLTSVRMSALLNLLLEKASGDAEATAAWEVQDGIVRIASVEDINRNQTMVIYDVNDLLLEPPDYDNAPDFNLQQALQSQTGGGGGGQSPFEDADEESQNPPKTREELLDEIVDILLNSVDSNGWVDNGGTVGTLQRFRGNLIIRNTPKNHREIGKLLSRLREIRNMQISVETRFLLVSQEFYEKIGFDLDVYFGGNSNEYRQLQLNDPSLSLGEFYQQYNTSNASGGGRFPQDTDGDGVVDTIAVINQPINVPGAQFPQDSWSPVGAQQGSIGIVNSIERGSGAAGDFVDDVLGTDGSRSALRVGGSFLDDIQVDFLIEATQADRRSVNLNAPRLTFTNGQTSFILVANQIAYVGDLEPIISERAVAFDPTVAVLSVGARLVIRGVISSDRRYVTMNVETAINDLIGFEPATVTAQAGGGDFGAGSDFFSAEFQTPQTRISQVSTTVTVPDQGTILLGGQRIVDEVEVESGVPVLSKIPLLNRFFSNRSTAKVERSIMILIRPTILIQSEEENRANPGLIDKLDSER